MKQELEQSSTSAKVHLFFIKVPENRIPESKSRNPLIILAYEYCVLKLV